MLNEEEFYKAVSFKIDGVTHNVPKGMLPVMADYYADMVIASKQPRPIKDKLPVEIAKAVARKELGITK